MFLRTFGWSFAITLVGLIAAGLLWGAEGFGIVLILSILEISLSFDNAVVNATVLKRMNPYWQKIFLTVGVLIAVFGMRLIFPLLVVGLTAHLNPATVIDLALHSDQTYNGSTYAQYLEAANPAIAAFGGIFLLMIFLDFIFEEKDFNWLSWIEKPLEKVGKLEAFSSVIALVTLALAANFFAAENAETVLLAGIMGLVTYLAVNGLSSVFEAGLEEEEEAEEEAEKAGKSIVQVGGKAAFFLFMYLEVLDASFSFDGVVGAFAITQDIFMITLGLGIGAMYIRSLTVFLVRKGTLDDYVYLEHGAHYAIGALAIILLVGIEYHIPEIVTGLIGVAFIGLALGSSILRNRRAAAAGGGGDSELVGSNSN
ncbi:hypothetical protein GCM10010495_16630 [Kitasatospora herbaricolor]|uniref:DUF475 domain-containing protein n=1 Tax=Kitasatospora herbaricolor TaxID=68217 RepID=UPI00174E36E4|nr:DUF475 domain-containing protein [Kitasatospora herbaricolor]MDQ0308120.1 hypothetical protein [Kitasatospora herbaricolor]GGV05510.1 hypothetical protein GCM10010495_16630 [Kitasatospora herbaricolor]